MGDRLKNTVDVVSKLSTVLATLVLGAAGLFVSSRYNSAQLEIAERKELGELIQSLESGNPAARRTAAAMLRYHGSRAVPALLSFLDEEPPFSDVARTSLVAIGSSAEPQVETVFRRSGPLRTKAIHRGNALYVLLSVDPDGSRRLKRSSETTLKPRMCGSRQSKLLSI